MIKSKTLQIRMTETQLAAVREAAKRMRLTASEYGASVVLGAVLDGVTKEADAVEELRKFRELFCRAMELSLVGKLTPDRFRKLEKGTVGE